MTPSRSDQTLLLAYDGSETARHAIASAATLLAPRRARVVFVWEPIAEALLRHQAQHFAPASEVSSEFQALEASESQRLADAGAEFARRCGLEAEGEAVRGSAKGWPTLCELAEREHAAAIVIGTRGLGRAASALLGSVAAGVIGHAKVPVLVVPPDPHGVETRQEDVETLIAFDGSEHAERAVQAVAGLARSRRVTVATVWIEYAAQLATRIAGVGPELLATDFEQMDSALRAGAQQCAEVGAARAREQGLEAQPLAVRATTSVPEALAETARERGAGMIALGRHGHSRIGEFLFGSVTRKLLHATDRPLLVVPAPR